jgi:hypothetical protein
MANPNSKVFVSILFLTRSGAAAGIDALHAAGYTTLVGDHVIDAYSDETVFAEAYTPACSASSDVDAVWQDVARIIEPLDGDAVTAGLMADDHVPFADYATT